MTYMVMILVSALLLAATSLELWHGLRVYSSIRRATSRAKAAPQIDPPSVSVCIPARNETHAMAECLERVLASDYKKLEILVFDDDSADSTSNIIRSFAQSGVRFVAGTAIPEGWLGKNYALDVLSKEASGTYVLFLDVDTIIAPTTIRRLVDEMLAGSKSMVSVIPERADGWRLSVLFGHLRYFWELSVNTTNQPAAASAVWMIDRGVLLNELGGLEAYRATAATESAIAARLGARYRCLVSTPEIEVFYEKKWSSQAETSKRLLFPRASGTLAGGLLALSSLLLLNVPLTLFLSGFIVGWSSLQVAAGISMVVGMLLYGIYTHTMWRKAWWAGALCWPIVVAQELFFFIDSMQGYYRHTITWKGRPISPYPRPLPTE